MGVTVLDQGKGTRVAAANPGDKRPKTGGKKKGHRRGKHSDLSGRARDAQGRLLPMAGGKGKSGHKHHTGTQLATQNGAQMTEGKKPRKRRRRHNPGMGELAPLVGGAAAGAAATIGLRAILRGLKPLQNAMSNPTVAALISNGVPGAVGAGLWFYGRKHGKKVLVAIGAGMVASAVTFLVYDLVGQKIEEGVAKLTSTQGIWLQRLQAQRAAGRLAALERDVVPPRQRTAALERDYTTPRQRMAALERDIVHATPAEMQHLHGIWVQRQKTADTPAAATTTQRSTADEALGAPRRSFTSRRALAR